MRTGSGFSVILAIVLAGLALSALGQDSQSLGDAARQARQQKQSKTTQTKAAKPSKVITNEELPSRGASSPSEVTEAANEDNGGPSESPHHGNAGSVPAETWKLQILAQKNAIAGMQKDIDDLQDSIKFAPPNCVSGCVQWNERQREKQHQVERMQAQLEVQKKRLDEMQESARKQGYGSSVYDP